MPAVHTPEMLPTEEEPEDYSSDADLQDNAYGNRGCCFWIPDPSSCRSVWWQRIQSAPDNEDRWWTRGWKKVREWSEIVAGPKWKTFIRRFNKNRPGSLYNKQPTYRYDAWSYALNFDEGRGSQNDPVDQDFLRHDFSTRYASIPATAKSSMDLGKDAPSFT